MFKHSVVQNSTMYSKLLSLWCYSYTDVKMDELGISMYHPVNYLVLEYLNAHWNADAIQIVYWDNNETTYNKTDKCQFTQVIFMNDKLSKTNSGLKQ